MSHDAWSTIAESAFVTFGTYRRNGELVSVTVWIAPDGDELVVTSERRTGKVKRLRNDDRVVLRPSSRMGRVADDAITLTAHARDAGGPDNNPTASAALKKKYGVQYGLILGFERLLRRVQRRPGDRVILRVTRTPA